MSTTPRVKYGSLKLTKTRTGYTGERVLICDYADWKSHAPAIGDPFPNEPYLRCSSVDMDGYGAPDGNGGYAKALLTCRYATFQYVESAPLDSAEFGGEMLQTGVGRSWVIAGTTCEQSQAIFIPNIVRNVQNIMLAVPYSQILACIGKINSAEFLGFGPGCVLFEGASSEPQFDYERGVYIYRVTYRFNVRPQSWNIVWRAPKQSRDQEGNGLFNSSGDPIYVGGTAGTGGWDTTDPPFYNTADLSILP